MLLHRLVADKLIQPPKWLPDNTHYLTVMGSVAYAVSNDMSDMDCYGFVIPPKEMTFPHLGGHIPGFGRQVQNFEQWQQHHIRTQDGKEYDFSLNSIVKYFQLCMENNPNMVDSLFTPQRCVLHITQVGELVRENRKLFLHKGSFHKFKGYAYGQLQKVKSKTKSDNPKRQASIDACGFDAKAGYHVVRLALECEQILTEGDLDLERNREQLKAIRRGEWTVDRLIQFFEDKERHLENLNNESKLPKYPDEDAIKALLMKCLESHYGNLQNAVTVQTDADKLLAEMQAVLDRYQR
jgi:predicted nucleotidyltransferase